MPCGLLTMRMANAIRPFVTDRTVWDLGAGDLGYSRKLLELGACGVTAVDKSFSRVTPDPQIILVEQGFNDITPPKIDVAFLSWPWATQIPGLIRLLQASRIVIYLGCNTDGTACGPKPVFHYLTRREIIWHLPHPRNSLIIYGPTEAPGRPLVGEECAATQESLLSFEEAQRAVQSGQWTSPPPSSPSSSVSSSGCGAS